MSLTLLPSAISIRFLHMCGWWVPGFVPIKIIIVRLIDPVPVDSFLYCNSGRKNTKIVVKQESHQCSVVLSCIVMM